jgi:hypothetical protein
MGESRAGEMTDPDDVPAGVDITRPSSARLYDYFLGGTNNYPVDRAAGEKMLVGAPDMVDAVLANRGFHGRAAVWMARRGVRQFIDIGSGLPTQNNTHDSVHKIAPAARVVYVDIEPMVAALAGRLLAGDGTTAVVTANLRQPDAVLGHADVRRLIDFSQPVGLLMSAVLHFVPDDGDPWGLVRQYMAAVPPGSYLALSHGTGDNFPPRQVQAGMETYANASEQFYLRSRAQVEQFFDGLELVVPYHGAQPALTYAGLWGADDVETADSDGSRGLYCGVARRPGPQQPATP